MSYARKVTVDVVTAADETFSVDTVPLTGKLSAIHYVKHGSNAFPDTVDFTITNKRTGEVLWQESNVTASKVCRPRGATHSTAGAASLYAAAGQAVLDKIALAGDEITIAIAQGGVAKNGQFIIVVE